MVDSSRHHCDCLCEHCQRNLTGAFGPQPDGSPGLQLRPEQSAELRRSLRRALSSYYARRPRRRLALGG